MAWGRCPLTKSVFRYTQLSGSGRCARVCAPATHQFNGIELWVVAVDFGGGGGGGGGAHGLEATCGTIPLLRLLGSDGENPGKADALMGPDRENLCRPPVRCTEILRVAEPRWPPAALIVVTTWSDISTGDDSYHRESKI